MSPQALVRFAGAVDAFSVRVGQVASWLYPILMLVIVVNVILRYVFSIGSIELEEVQWHLYSMAFLLGFAYAYVDDAHVRVDVLHTRFSPRRKAQVEILGCIFLLLPFAGLLVYYSWPYFLESWAFNERSDMPSGLPARYVIKLVLVIGFAMLFAQGVAVLARKTAFLMTHPAR